MIGPGDLLSFFESNLNAPLRRDLALLCEAASEAVAMRDEAARRAPAAAAAVAGDGARQRRRSELAEALGLPSAAPSPRRSVDARASAVGLPRPRTVTRGQFHRALAGRESELAQLLAVCLHHRFRHRAQAGLSEPGAAGGALAEGDPLDARADTVPRLGAFAELCAKPECRFSPDEVKTLAHKFQAAVAAHPAPGARSCGAQQQPQSLWVSLLSLPALTALLEPALRLPSALRARRGEVCALVFAGLDAQRSGGVVFDDLVLGLSALVLGDAREQLRFWFGAFANRRQRLSAAQVLPFVDSVVFEEGVGEQLHGLLDAVVVRMISSRRLPELSFEEVAAALAPALLEPPNDAGRMRQLVRKSRLLAPESEPSPVEQRRPSLAQILGRDAGGPAREVLLVAAHGEAARVELPSVE